MQVLGPKRSGSAPASSGLPGKGFKARAATLSYLLTPGRRLDVHVLGCGAAGRIQELVAATERP